MIVDPMKRRRRRTAEQKGEAYLADPLLLHALSMELRPLGQLQTWMPVGSRMQNLTDALRQHGGVTDQDVHQLRVWAHRWAGLRTSLKEFYLKHLGDEVASIALYRVLEGGAHMTGPIQRMLHDLWLEQHGGPPGFPLVPHNPIQAWKAR